MWVTERVLSLVAVVAFLAGAGPLASPADPFLWLEDVHGARAQAWVKSENAKTLAVLQRDPHFATFYDAALAVNSAKDRIPYPDIISGRVYRTQPTSAASGARPRLPTTRNPRPLGRR